MQLKTTTKLFRGTYQYKIVLVCSGATWFRSGNMADTLVQLQHSNPENKALYRPNHIKTKEDFDYACGLALQLQKMKDLDIRVESPWISIYSNNKKDITTLTNLDKDRVKYICSPAPNTTLDEDTIIMPKMDYDYRITLGKTTQEYQAFVEWAESNPKLKLTKSCKKDLLRTRTWGGKHFYLTGDKNLLLAKMHLGWCIAKVERIVKS